MDEEKGLKTRLDELEQKVEEEKEKKFKLPWKARVGRAKVKKGWSTIMVLRDNGSVDFVKKQVKDGVVEVDGFPRVATVNHKLIYKNKPLYIIPTWSLKPFSPADNYSETEKDKMNIAGRRAVLASLETDKIKAKKDMGNMGWIILILAVGGVIWYLGKNQGWF